MKKVSTLFLFVGAVASAYGASNSVAFIESNTKDTAVSMGGANGDSYVLRINKLPGGDPEWKDYYLYLPVSSFDNIVYSSNGGNSGYHANYHVMLDASNPTVTSANGKMFNFNTNGTYKQASSYYLESKDGSAVEFVNTAAYNESSTSARGMQLDLSTQDGNGGDLYWGKTGKTFSVGENVTLRANTLIVLGQLTPNPDADPSVIKQSEFVVQKGGTVDAGALFKTMDSFSRIEGKVVADMVAVSTEAQNESVIKIQNGGVMQVQSVKTVDNGTIVVENGGRLELNTAKGDSFLNNQNAIYVNEGGVLYTRNTGKNNHGTMNSNASNSARFMGEIYVNGGVLSTNSVMSGDEYSAALVSGKIVISNGGKLLSRRSSDAEGTGTGLFALAGGTLQVEGETSSIEAKLIAFHRDSTAMGGAELEKTLILKNGSNFDGDIVAVRTKENTLILAENESYKFGSIMFHQQTVWNEITIDLNGASSVEINAVTRWSSSANGTLVFDDFVNGVVKINNLTDTILADINESGVAKYDVDTAKSFETQLSLKAIDAEGNVYDWTNGDWFLDGNGFLSHSALVAVPEPAEWAMILGALALGLAVYRRRK